MNLIMSDVVETVTIVDVDEETGAESLRVRPQFQTCPELSLLRHLARNSHE